MGALTKPSALSPSSSFPIVILFLPHNSAIPLAINVLLARWTPLGQGKGEKANSLDREFFSTQLPPSPAPLLIVPSLPLVSIQPSSIYPSIHRSPPLVLPAVQQKNQKNKTEKGEFWYIAKKKHLVTYIPNGSQPTKRFLPSQDAMSVPCRIPEVIQNLALASDVVKERRE